eukprot:TRINITY_DN687_c0_g2_i2.p1 TRINITY_DN687_c0_g2~~TRINITY_DN687_c0_g2_i2.p1  ORF type:complete len:206 (-),score=30.51 TRINITY_DN687_c0_g2_i2:182-799(-)
MAAATVSGLVAGVLRLSVSDPVSPTQKARSCSVRASSAIGSYPGLRADSSRQNASASFTSVRERGAGASPSHFPLGRGLNIRCARIAGVEVPNNKRIEASLQYIHGIGLTTAKAILADTTLLNKRVKDMSEEELTAVREEVTKYMVEGDLRRFNNLNIKRLKDIRCYRGMRHINNLPCRGQHTKCNARTKRGKKITVAGKKKAPK